MEELELDELLLDEADDIDDLLLVDELLDDELLADDIDDLLLVDELLEELDDDELLLDDGSTTLFEDVLDDELDELDEDSDDVLLDEELLDEELLDEDAIDAYSGVTRDSAAPPFSAQYTAALLFPPDAAHAHSISRNRYSADRVISLALFHVMDPATLVDTAENEMRLDICQPLVISVAFAPVVLVDLHNLNLT